MSLNANQLRQMLALDTDAVHQLKTLLLQERDLLPSRNHDQLSQILEQKTVLVDQLNQHAQIRQQLLRTLGLPENADGWDLFLQRNSLTLSLRDGWKQLMEDVAECKALNEINGKLIARSRQTLDHLLNLLRGKAPAPSLYTANGEQTQQSHSHTLAKA